ncbi:MAG: TonB-dependent receptor, partial [Pseudomonadota bacterium]
PGSALSSGGPFRGFETFTPGQGACQPLNLFGVGAPSQAAIDFITTDLRRERTIEQTVISGFLSGDSSSFLTLPGGPIAIVVGAEFRLEESIFVADALESPRPDSLPESSRSALAVRSLTFPADGPVASVDGEFNVWELYGEASVPLLNNMPYAETLRLDGAYRYSDYDNLGGQNTWNVGLVYEPIVGLTLRGSFSQTVRAPNINELFSPLTAATARPVDVCTQDAITDPNSNRAINCAADGLPTDFADPNTARVSGFQGGNPDLEAEKADTFTAGFVLTPTALPNFVLTVDYYDITIDDGIDDVGLAQVLTACYDSDPATFADNPFCTRFERDRDSTSATFLGLSNFTLVEENFASIETSGFDFTAQYQFALGDLTARLAPYGDLLLRVVGNKVEELERFEDPVDSSIVNDLLFENGQPEWAINTDIRWAVGALTVNLQSRYLGEFLEMTPRLEIETVDTFDNAWTGEIWRHDLSATYDIKEGVRVYGGINNLAGVDPIKSETAYPFGALGRSFFFGTNVRF